LKFLFFVLFCASFAAFADRPDFLFQTAQKEYWRFELVDFKVKGTAFGLNSVSKPVLAVQVRYGRSVVLGPGERRRILLRWNPEQSAWTGRWAIPWGVKTGEYTAELLVPPPRGFPDPAYAGRRVATECRDLDRKNVLARIWFTIKGRPPLRLPPGFSVVSLEPGKYGYSVFKGLNEEPPAWAHMIDWAKFMRADAFWHCAGETQIWKRRLEADYPWNRGGLRMARKISELAHEKGLTYGAYLLAFLVLGDNFQLADYTFSTGFSKEDQVLEKKRFISLGCKVRQRYLVEMLKELQSLENVDYIGMDYVRTDFSALEFTDDFLKDMGLRLPAELEAGPKEERMKWLGALSLAHSDAYIEELWQWWRSHKVAEVIHQVLAEAGVTKPVWIFTLGWMQGHQHGQDPFMLIDAGASFNSPMFYEVTEQGYPPMLQSWADYLGRGEESLVLGQVVDGKLLGEDENRGGPEVHFQRQMQALEALGPVSGSLGFFWHDINRAMCGGRSLHTTKEWAVSGAATFSRLRESQNMLQVKVDFNGAWTTPWGVSFTVTVKNLSGAAIPRVRLDGIPLAGVGSYRPFAYEWGPLKAGEIRPVPWAAVFSEAESFGKLPHERRMLAVRATVARDEKAYPDFSFSYVKVPLSYSRAVASRRPAEKKEGRP
jgi:hypothetical protein